MAIEDLRTRDWILLPGTLCTGDVFTEFLDALGVPVKRRRPVRLDRPAVEDYADALRDAEGAIICGFSLGAIVAAHHADLSAPARTILFGLNPFPDDPGKADGRRALERDVALQGGANAMSSRVPTLHGPRPDDARAKILAMADIAQADIAAQTRLSLTRPGALDALSQSPSPVLVLTGGEDTMAPPSQGRAAVDAAPLGRFREISGLGHYALVEDPAACADAFMEMEDALE